MMRYLYLLLTIGLAWGGAAWSPLALKSKNALTTAVAIADSNIAVGFAAGGVSVMNRISSAVDTILIDEFGPRRRIYDLAWWKSWLLIASEGGLSVWDTKAKKMVVHLSASKLGFQNPEAFSIYVRGADVWVGGNRQIAQVNLDLKKVEATWTMPGNPGKVQTLLVLGSTAYAGTEYSGVYVLDLSRGSWKSFDQFDGLPNNQVTGLQLMGSKIAVGTLQGLGRIDLNTESAMAVDTTTVVSFMTQWNGTLLLSTLEGLVNVDGISWKSKIVEIQDDVGVQGNLDAFGDMVVFGTENRGVAFAEWAKTALPENPVSLDAQGAVLFVNETNLQAKDLIVAKMWYPERAGAEIRLEVMPGSTQGKRSIALPEDAVGHFVIELTVLRGKIVVDHCTQPVFRDRTPPSLEVEAVPTYVRESSIQVRGKIAEQTKVIAEVSPRGLRVPIDPQGRFEVKVPLTKGVNIWEILARDASGNEQRYPMQTIMDADAPSIKWPTQDTVAEAFLRWQVPFHEANLKQVIAEPTNMLSATVSDTILQLYFHDLKIGRNHFRIVVDDMAGNRSEKELDIHYFDERTQIVQQMDQQAKTVGPVAIKQKVDTVYRCTTKVETQVEQAPLLPSVSETNVRGSYLIRYSMKRGETLRLLAERFYGDRELYVILARFNNLPDNEVLYRLPIGTVIVVPMWQDFEFGKINVKKAMERFKQVVIP